MNTGSTPFPVDPDHKRSHFAWDDNNHMDFGPPQSRVPSWWVAFLEELASMRLETYLICGGTLEAFGSKLGLCDFIP